MQWSPLKLTLTFFALMFNGMQWSRGAQPVPLVLWAGAFAIVLAAAIARWKESGEALRRRAMLLVPVIIAMCVLPSWAGTFTFINLRVAAIVYFLLALAAAEVEFRGRVEVRAGRAAGADHGGFHRAAGAHLSRGRRDRRRSSSGSRRTRASFRWSSTRAPPNWNPASSTRTCTTTIIITSSSAAGSIPISSKRRSFPRTIEKARSGPRRANTTPGAFPGRSIPRTTSTSSPAAPRNRSSPTSRADAIEVAASGEWTLYERRR